MKHTLNLIQISRVSRVLLPAGTLQRRDLQTFIRNIYRNKNLATRTGRRKYAAFSASRSTTENTLGNRSHFQDANPLLQGEQSMEVSYGVAQELQGEDSKGQRRIFPYSSIEHKLCHCNVRKSVNRH